MARKNFNADYCDADTVDVQRDWERIDKHYPNETDESNLKDTAGPDSGPNHAAHIPHQPERVLPPFE